MQPSRAIDVKNLNLAHNYSPASLSPPTTTEKKKGEKKQGNETNICRGLDSHHHKSEVVMLRICGPEKLELII